MKRNWIIPLTLVILFIAIWFARDTVPKKPLQPEQESPRASLTRELDLAGGPEKEKRGFPKRKILDLSSLFPDIVFNRGPADAKKVALTFDDGPDNIFTPQILDVLKQKKVKATFFIMGKRAQAFPKILERMIDEGHLVANHTWSHPNLMKLSNEDIKKEISKTDQFLENKCNSDTKYFRSPYGSLDPERVKLIGGMGYKIIAWNVDSLDWKGLSSAEVKTNILENVSEGAIILQHSAGGIGEDLSGTVKALPGVIDTLRKEGYQFVTIKELLQDKNEKGQDKAVSEVR